MAPFVIRQASSQSSENKDNAVFSVCAVFLALSSAGMAARVASKRIKRSEFLVEDLLIIWAYVSPQDLGWLEKSDSLCRFWQSRRREC